MTNIPKGCHTYKVMVFYEDTDAAGVVYHGNYIKFMERARTIFLNDHKLSLHTLINDYKVQFLVCNLNIAFEKPARLEQSLTVATKITNLGRASLTFGQEIYLEDGNNSIRLCQAEVVVACTNLNYKPVAIPKEIVQELKRDN